MTNEIKQDTTDISVSFNLTNNTAYYPRSHPPVQLNVIQIRSNSDYVCYMNLINWRVPVRSVANLDAFLQDFSTPEKCGSFASRVGNQDAVYSYYNQRDDLFTQPLNVNISNMMVIVDNTQQLLNLRAFTQTGTSKNARPVSSSQYLQYDIEVTYKLSDRWFIMTVTFACLDALALAAAIGVFVQFKKSKKEHREFRSRRQKWYQYDQEYEKVGGGIGDMANEYG